MKDIDIHAVTGLLKMYLRELPEALFTSQLYKKFFEAFSKFFNFMSCLFHLEKIVRKTVKVLKRMRHFHFIVDVKIDLLFRQQNSVKNGAKRTECFFCNPFNLSNLFLFSLIFFTLENNRSFIDGRQVKEVLGSLLSTPFRESKHH